MIMKFMKIEKRKVRTIKSQIDRLNEAFHSLGNEETKINSNFENSMIGQEVKMLRKTIEDQNSIIGTFSVTDFIKKIKVVLDNNTNSEMVDRKQNENNNLIVQLKELDTALMTVKQEQEMFSNQLTKLKMERRVLGHLIKSNYQMKNKNVVEQ